MKNILYQQLCHGQPHRERKIKSSYWLLIAPQLQAKFPHTWETVSPSSRQLKYLVGGTSQGGKGWFFHGDQLSNSDLWPPTEAPGNDSCLYVPETVRGIRECWSPQEKVSMWKNPTINKKIILYLQLCLRPPHRGTKIQN